MKEIIKEFINAKEKTNLHALLCLKRIYVDQGRSIDQSFQQREVSSMWKNVAEINPNFLNSGVAPVFMTKQKFITKVGEELFILEQYRDSFREIDWNILIEKVQSIQPLIAPIYEKLVSDRENFIEYTIQTLNNTPQEIEIRVVPALLEIFSYAVLKTHLKFFGADIFRWTRTNSNDGGVDMTCGDISYSITTNLNYNKMDGDASKQVRDRLNFVTIKSKVQPEKIREIEQLRELSINVIELKNLSEMVNKFNTLQKEQLLEILTSEIEKEL